MNEPRRLLDEGGTPFERSLLSALGSERPSPELERRMRQGLGAAGALASAKVASAGLIKVAVVGLAAVGLSAGVFAWRLGKPQPPPQVAPAAPIAPALSTVEPAPATQPAAEEASRPAEEPAARPRPAPSGAADLREEIRLLDQARAAVRGGENARALKLLDRYERRYPRGQFRQEAEVLAVEALERSGKRQAALALGKKFLAEHPESPHVERVESVTGSGR